MVVDKPMGWVEVELDHGSGWAQNMEWMTNTDCIIQNRRNRTESTEQKARNKKYETEGTEREVRNRKYGTDSTEQKQRDGMRSKERKAWTAK